MTQEELSLRMAIVDRINKRYPTVQKDYTSFVSGQLKPSIDSWLGDSFAILVKREQYDHFRKLLFCD